MASNVPPWQNRQVLDAALRKSEIKSFRTSLLLFNYREESKRRVMFLASEVRVVVTVAIISSISVLGGGEVALSS